MRALSEEWKRRDKEREVLVQKKVNICHLTQEVHEKENSDWSQTSAEAGFLGAKGCGFGF